MKKSPFRLSVLLLTFLLLVVLAGCSAENHPKIEQKDWVMFTAQDLEKEGAFVAGGKGSGAYAPVLLTCRAKDGRLELMDATNHVFYQADYEQAALKKDVRLYEIAFDDGQKGQLALSHTDWRNGSKRATMILTVGNYSVTFYEAEKD